MSYRWAGIVLLVSFCVMVYFCWVAGCRLWFGLLLVGLIVASYGMWARLRAEAGMGFLPFPLEIGNGLTALIGSRTLLPRELVTLISVRWSYFPGFGESSEVLVGNALESYKIATRAGIKRGGRPPAGWLSCSWPVVFGTFVLMRGFYRGGYFGTAVGGMVISASWQTLNDGFDLHGPHHAQPCRIPEASSPSARGVVNDLSRDHAVALLVVALPPHRATWSRTAMGSVDCYVRSSSAGCGSRWWIRYGGLRLYRAAVPLAVGMILGDQLNAGVWAVVALVTGGKH